MYLAIPTEIEVERNGDRKHWKGKGKGEDRGGGGGRERLNRTKPGKSQAAREEHSGD